MQESGDDLAGSVDRLLKGGCHCEGRRHPLWLCVNAEDKGATHACSNGPGCPGRCIVTAGFVDGGDNLAKALCVIETGMPTVEKDVRAGLVSARCAGVNKE